ncbi:helix-turn-helix domain-containing protein [Micromonospora sp. C28SCA-DRY-2]|uniref:helix-turn-helix domain-containing protein n=1 Tax=Micromonospora sp. C28SCA-DRY-2 TaxID=3059522 RepID=UPI002675A709|nr:helix-turn-helix domain-containing protein [Micromonospora sp. C28SCA-DRY-2]MDO3703255.1 helix-turn-helix domain-containing protein [Micromonospora sp. C28SCA-DRY-2]
MAIGLVIHASHRSRFEAAARTLAGVTLEWVTYGHEGEIRDRVRALLDRRNVDGLLLGPVPYARCRDVLPADLPVSVLRSAGLDLALAWCRALAEGWPATPVSIDTFDLETVDEVTHALELDRSQISCLPFDPEQRIEEIVEFHRDALRTSGGTYVISVRTGVMGAFAGRVPVMSGLPGPATIRAELHELALRIRSKQADKLRFAAGVFLVNRLSPNLDRARVGLMNMLLNTPGFADCWIEDRDRRGVVVFAHRALFETVTHSWSSLPVLAQAQETLGVRVVAGFGIGASARTCVTLAERAAARAEQDVAPGAYLIEDSGVVIGPMGPSGTPLSFTYREHGADVEELARSVGLSPATLSRLTAIERSLNGRSVSPSDLATALGITDPSGRRLIRKLGEHGLVIPEGSAQVNRKGRPTRLYRLAISSGRQ